MRRISVLALLVACSSADPGAGADARSTNLQITVRSGGWANGAPLSEELQLLVDDEEVALSGSALRVFDASVDRSTVKVVYENRTVDAFEASAETLCSGSIGEPGAMHATLCLRSNGELALASATCTSAAG